MTFADVAVVYLSLGAPFAVNDQFRQTDRTMLVRIVVFGSILLFWPFYLVVLLADLWGREKVAVPGSAAVFEKQIESVKGIDRRSSRALVSLFSHYFALANELAHESDEPVVPAEVRLVALAGHPAETIAAACFSRRQARLLSSHLAAVRQALRAEIKKINDADAHSRVSELIADAAKTLGDKQGESLFRDSKQETQNLAQRSSAAAAI
ncbi:MAG: hypothetical protein KF736_13110 [Acidobacteria bacterium]|nr:hypothetical protein [Acidobacteriota bacterium]MCW5950352.1 hypothetical protein [Pyrinomonadaceae bacterium]